MLKTTNKAKLLVEPAKSMELLITMPTVLTDGNKLRVIPECFRCKKDLEHSIEDEDSPKGFYLTDIVGTGMLYLCNSCIDHLHKQNMEMNQEIAQSQFLFDTPTPSQIIQYLNEYVIGQDDVKKMLATVAHMHCAMLALNACEHEIATGAQPKIGKNMPLIIGPSGCGKTLLLEKLAQLMKLPFATMNAAKVTKNGYKGESVSDTIRRLYLNANQDKEKTEIGIVLIDEVDKLAGHATTSIDVTNTGVQQELLKLIEGEYIVVSKTIIVEGEAQTITETISTSNILFIFAGAFEGLDKVIEKHIGSSSIGFGANTNKNNDNYNLLAQAKSEDFLNYGMMKELMGRLGAISQVHALTENEMLHILTQPRDAIISQMEHICLYNGCNLFVDEGVLKHIAQTAMEDKEGARALRKIVMKFMVPIICEIAEESVDNMDVVVEMKDGEIVYRLEESENLVSDEEFDEGILSDIIKDDGAII